MPKRKSGPRERALGAKGTSWWSMTIKSTAAHNWHSRHNWHISRSATCLARWFWDGRRLSAMLRHTARTCGRRLHSCCRPQHMGSQPYRCGLYNIHDLSILQTAAAAMIPLTSRSRHPQPPTPLIEQSTGLLGSWPLYTSKSDEPDLPLSRSSLGVRKGVREHNRRHKNNEQTKDEYDTVYTATLSKIDRWTLSPHQQSSSGLSLPVADADTLSKIDRWMSSTEPSLHRHSSLPIVKNDLQTEPAFAEHKRTSTPSGVRTLRHVPLTCSGSKHHNAQAFGGEVRSRFV